MSTAAFGPVELFILSFPQPELPTRFRQAVAEVLESGAVTLLDIVIARRLEDERLEIIEFDALSDHLEITSLELNAQGLIGDEDLAEVAADLPVGETAIAIAIEHTWARQVVGSMMDAGASVVLTERIPATVVNEVALLAAID